jgi:hypothetical protein
MAATAQANEGFSAAGGFPVRIRIEPMPASLLDLLFTVRRPDYAGTRTGSERMP